MSRNDIEIARGVEIEPIEAVAERAGVPRHALHRYGPYKGKVDADWLIAREVRGDSKLILVTAVNPTSAGEGKTTTTIGLGDALRRIGKSVQICLREPSLGPCFGIKGGGTGGGHAQIVPMEDVNLHFTGDFYAVGAAHNLLSAMTDNHVYWDNQLGIDVRRILWRRAADINDRALRRISCSLGGNSREDGFDVVAASEVMAVLCLAKDLADLKERLGKIAVAETRGGKPVSAEQIKASGAMAALLRDSFAPNLVQTLEGTPAFVHGGPFANVAHGCSSVIATQSARKLAEYTVTEAGFGADLGAEKFLNIKCRKAGFAPDAAVLVATVRALKLHGGLPPEDLDREDPHAVSRGCANAERHLENLAKFGIPSVVAINRFAADTDAELRAAAEGAEAFGARAVLCSHWADGSAGAEALALEVVRLAESGRADLRFLYEDRLPLWQKVETISREIYHAGEVSAAPPIREQFDGMQEKYGRFPVCIAKTPYSFSSDPALRGAPAGHELNVRGARLSAGAEFVVVVCGGIMTMPGLPRRPAAEAVHLDGEGRIQGLF